MTHRVASARAGAATALGGPAGKCRTNGSADSAAPGDPSFDGSTAELPNEVSGAAASAPQVLNPAIQVQCSSSGYGPSAGSPRGDFLEGPRGKTSGATGFLSVAGRGHRL